MTDLPDNDQQIDLWIVRYDADLDELPWNNYRALLNQQEQQQTDRRTLQRVQREFLLSRALIRSVLSSYSSNTPPARWEFTYNAHGKPFLSGPVDLPLQFNISHTHNRIICGVSTCASIGVDIERIERRSQYADLAERFFAPDERNDVTNLTGESQRRRFFEYWTLKESFIKARGKGLAIPLDDFAFRLHPDRPPQITFRTDDHGSPSDWQFVQLQIGDTYQVAIALQHSALGAIGCRVREILPLIAIQNETQLEFDLRGQATI